MRYPVGACVKTIIVNLGSVKSHQYWDIFSISVTFCSPGTMFDLSFESDSALGILRSTFCTVPPNTHPWQVQKPCSPLSISREGNAAGKKLGVSVSTSSSMTKSYREPAERLSSLPSPRSREFVNIFPRQDTRSSLVEAFCLSLTSLDVLQPKPGGS